MNPVETYRCNGCGQTFKLERMEDMTAGPAQVCPYCGTRGALERVKSSFGSLDAACFKALKVDKALLTFLWQDWRENKRNQQGRHPLFRSYVEARLNAAIAGHI